jgi:hypothetical protein
MKHIKRKFRDTTKLTEQAMKVRKFQQFSTIDENIDDDGKVYFITSEDISIGAFKYKDAGKVFCLPEPEPVLIYFNIAQSNYKDIKDKRKELLVPIDFKNPDNTREMMHSMYSFLAYSSSFTVFLFTAIETLINQCIPLNAVYLKTDRKQTTTMNFIQIQMYVEFKEKLTKVLSQITGKSFHKDHPQDYDSILKLKEFRDEIVHTKKKSSKQTEYTEIFTRSLDFDYDKAILATRDLINYYRPNLVEECDCGRDF